MEAVLWKPGSIAFDKEGTLYIVEDDDRDIRIVKDNQIATFLRGDKTDGVAFRMMNIAFHWMVTLCSCLMMRMVPEAHISPLCHGVMIRISMILEVLLQYGRKLRL